MSTSTVPSRACDHETRHHEFRPPTMCPAAHRSRSPARAQPAPQPRALLFPPLLFTVHPRTKPHSYRRPHAPSRTYRRTDWCRRVRSAALARIAILSSRRARSAHVAGNTSARASRSIFSVAIAVAIAAAADARARHSHCRRTTRSRSRPRHIPSTPLDIAVV
jgi:hypothetical protein